jgi:hypothetical protein
MSRGAALGRCRFGEPGFAVGVSGKRQQPAKQTEPVTAAQPVSRRIGCDRGRNPPGIVEGRPERVGYHLGDRTWVFPVGQQIGHDSAGAGYGQASKSDAVKVHIASVQAYVFTPALLPCRQRELVRIRR